MVVCGVDENTGLQDSPPHNLEARIPKTTLHKGRATSHTRVRARDHYTSSTLVGGKGGAGPNSLHTRLEGPNRVCECKMVVKVCMDSYMASNGSCFIITWTLFKNHLLEVRLTQNRWEITALRTLTTVDTFYCIICEDMHE